MDHGTVIADSTGFSTTTCRSQTLRSKNDSSPALFLFCGSLIGKGFGSLVGVAAMTRWKCRRKQLKAVHNSESDQKMRIVGLSVRQSARTTNTFVIIPSCRNYQPKTHLLHVETQNNDDISKFSSQHSTHLLFPAFQR